MPALASALQTKKTSALRKAHLLLMARCVAPALMAPNLSPYADLVSRFQPLALP